MILRLSSGRESDTERGASEPQQVVSRWQVLASCAVADKVTVFVAPRWNVRTQKGREG